MDRSSQGRTTSGVARVAAVAVAAVALLVCGLAASGAGAQSAKPAARPEPEAAQAPSQAVVTLWADGQLFLGSERIVEDEIEYKLLAIVDRDDRIYLRADKRSRYDRVMHVMDVLRRSGFTKVALVAWDGR